MSTTNTDLAHSFFRELWNEGKDATIDVLMAPDVVSHGLGPDLTGRESFRAFYHRFRGAFASIRVTLDHVAESDGLVAYRGWADAVTRATGQAIVVPGAGFIRFRDGRIQEGWNYWNFLGMVVQLGAAPPDVMDQALARAGGVIREVADQLGALAEPASVQR